MNSKAKLLYLILILSLVGNIFALGVWIGKELRPHGPDDRRPPAGEMMNMRKLISYLPDDKREELRELMDDHRQDLRMSFRNIRGAEQEVRDLLTAETVDKAALAAALDRLETNARQVHAPLRSILLEIVADLDLETRQKLAEDMYQRRKLRLKDGGRFRGDGPPPRDGFRPGPPPPRPEDEDEWLEGEPDDRPPPPPNGH